MCVGEYLLEDVKNYTFLTHGNVPVPGVDDAIEFKSTCQAMQIMGLQQEDLSGKIESHIRRTKYLTRFSPRSSHFPCRIFGLAFR